MRTHFIEVENDFNWGKFMLAQYEEQDWTRKSEVTPQYKLLGSIGWHPGQLWVLDLQTCEGYGAVKSAVPLYDLEQKHQIWTCPMFAPFLLWLHKQDWADITKFPAYLKLDPEGTKQYTAISGYRRQGSEFRPASDPPDSSRPVLIWPLTASHFPTIAHYHKENQNWVRHSDRKQVSSPWRWCELPKPKRGEDGR